ncbi:MAG TPA: DNA topoisomerase IB [Actinomycetota bacterium]|nr:DNA topoisomerase IB [Actinomycetota bacterium]
MGKTRAMPRLRRVDCSAPGIVRRRRGRGFEYYDERGERIDDPDVLERIRALVIPPAWTDVWISPYPFGHIQAVGTDAAGRRQYLYHVRWRARRDQEKCDEMIRFARALPELRAVAAEHLRLEGMPRERALACAVRLLDRGFFRIGTEDYAEQNQTYGLATMQKRHVTLRPGYVITFDYAAKGGKRRIQSIVDPDVYGVVDVLKRRRSGPELLAYKQRHRWLDVTSADINEYVKEVTGADFSAKDFRTWNGTVLAAVALAVSARAATTKTARKRAIARAIKEVAHYMGNTPAVARASYIDPRVFDRFRAGVTIGGALERVGDVELGQPSTQGTIEEAVLDLLEEDDASPAIEKVA